MNSDTTKTTFRLLAVLCASVLLLTASAADGVSQEYRDYLLKKIGNLYILNIGANDGVQNYQVYNLFFEKKVRFLRIPVKTDREYFGAVQVKQLFPEYCVVRVVARYLEDEPEGNRIVMVKRRLPAELLERSYKASGLSLPDDLRKELEEQIEHAPEGETVTKQVDLPEYDETFRPFSAGIGYFHDYDQIAQPVTDYLAVSINRDLYGGGGIISSDLSSNGGIALSLSKMLTTRFMISGGFSYISHNSKLNTRVDPEQRPPVGARYLEEWNFDLNTTVKAGHFTLQFSQFDKALAHFIGTEKGRPFAPRFGIGGTYASVNVEMDEKARIAEYDKFSVDNIGYVDRTLTEKFSLGGYWGMHAVAGIDWYVQAWRLFAEAQYQHWFTDKFDSNIPFRLGAEIFF